MNWCGLDCTELLTSSAACTREEREGGLARWREKVVLRMSCLVGLMRRAVQRAESCADGRWGVARLKLVDWLATSAGWKLQQQGQLGPSLPAPGGFSLGGKSPKVCCGAVA